MASWKKYFSAVPTQTRLQQRLNQQNNDGGATGSGSVVKFNSFLPEVYSGAPNRIERYIQYEAMDLDSEISKALDTISDFSTQNYEISEEPFTFNYKGKLTETEITLLKESLSQWCSLNKWQQRLWRMFRNTVKYGDQMFIRDPETFKLIWVDPTKVEKLIVNESKGKEIEQYVIRDLDLNLVTLVGTNMLVHDQYSFPGGYPRSSNPASGAGTINYGQSSSPGSRSSRFDNMPNQAAINAEHILHLSLSEGLDNQWPFGTSILESIYKVYKQKDLLEDAILIYRIVRAPERRVFYIDVGSLSGPRAMQYVERIKNEIYQRRIPNRCLSLDTKIYLLDGRLLALRDIINEFNIGKTNWVYSCNPATGAIVPGKITWAGKTKMQTKCVKLTLDNGQEIICTPDHKFPILGKGFIEAQNLEIGESFIPLYLREKNFSNSKNKAGYTQIFDNVSKKWKYTHRVVTEYFISHFINEYYNKFIFDEKFASRGQHTIHHKDFNRYNNNPDNLIWMNSQDHIIYHSQLGEFNKVKWENFRKDTVRYNAYINELHKRSKEFWSNDELRIQAVESRLLKYDRKLYNIFKNVVTNALINYSGNTLESFNVKYIAELLTNDTTFITYFKKLNYKFENKNRLECISTRDVKNLIKKIGRYNTCTIFLNEILLANNVSIDHSEYHYSDKLFELFNIVYFNSNNSSLVKLIAELNVNKNFVDEFNNLHLNRNLTICRAFIVSMLSNYGYKHFREFRKKNINSKFSVRSINLKKYKFNINMLNIFKKHYQTMLYNKPNIGFTKLYQIVQKDLEFITEFNTENPKSKKNRLGPDLIREMLISFNFRDYNDFRKKYIYLNHKLVKIEWLSELVDTGTISVDSEEQYHNYHTFAIEGGIFTKNSGGGQSVIDTAYNPIAINEDYFLATNAEGKGTRIETLGGGENLGVIDDLKYFNNKMIRGLGVPSSYLPTGADDGTAVYTDGKVGTAYIQEYRFSKYCLRLQNLMAPQLDKEFKMFIKQRGIEIQSNLFELQFFPPQSFSQYRQMQLDSEQVQLFTSLMGTDASKYVSKRFALERYLGWTEEDVLKNEQLWKEENAKKVKDKTGAAPGSNENVGLGGVGIRPEPTDIMSELGGEEGEAEPGQEGPPGGAPAPGGAPGPGGAAPAPGGGAAPAPAPGGGAV